MATERQIRLHRSGGDRIVRLPRDFEFETDWVVLRKLDGGGLLLEPSSKPSLHALLSGLEPLDEDFPDIEDGPADPVEI